MLNQKVIVTKVMIYTVTGANRENNLSFSEMQGRSQFGAKGANSP